MRIWLNDINLTLIPGMTVRQVLIQADLVSEIEKGAKVFDEWGNEVGLDGAVEKESRFTLRPAGRPAKQGRENNGSR